MDIYAAQSKAQAADQKARISMDAAIATGADFMREKAANDADAALQAWREVWRIEETMQGR